MASFKNRERRKDARVPFSCKVIITYAGGKIASQITDISKGGIKVVLQKEIKHLSSVSLEIALMKKHMISCEGKVVWIMERVNKIDRTSSLYHTGIAFTEISAADKEYIKKVVEAFLNDKLRNLDKK